MADRKIIKTFLIILILCFSTSGRAADNAKSIIEDMTHKLRGHENVSDYEMTITRPAWTRSIRLKAWDDRKNHRAFVRILEPAKEAGVSFLRIGYNLWNYLPAVEKVMKIPPSMMLQPWMGSDFTNDDLVKESSYIEDYTHETVSQETKDGINILQLRLTPKPNAPVVWGSVVFWVREKDHLPVRQNFIDERGTLIKDLVFSDFKTLDGMLIPTRWEMTPVNRPGQKTVLLLKSIDFDPVPKISDSVFSEKNLRP